MRMTTSDEDGNENDTRRSQVPQVRIIREEQQRGSVSTYNDHKAAALDATPIACLGVRQSEHAFGIKN